MSLRILISSSTALLAILVIALSYQASASRLTTDPASTEAVAGICSAAEIMHGYKCQEYDVSTTHIFTRPCTHFYRSSLLVYVSRL